MDYKTWIKNNKPIWAIIFFIVVGIPLVLFLLVDLLELGINNISDSVWLGFWGSYLGAILSTTAAILTLGWYVVQYMESEKLRKINDADQRVYEMLSQNKPILKVTPLNSDCVDNCKSFFEMNKFVYAVNEDISKAIQSTDEKEIIVQFKNVGYGPICYLEIENSTNENNQYSIGGPVDRNINNDVINAPSLIDRFTLDLFPGEEEIVKLKFRISPTCKNNVLIRNNLISLKFIFKDSLDNELFRDASIRFDSKIVNCEKQKYVDTRIDKFFENRINKSIDHLERP